MLPEWFAGADQPDLSADVVETKSVLFSHYKNRIIELQLASKK
jgi:hypothetical protein